MPKVKKQLNYEFSDDEGEEIELTNAVHTEESESMSSDNSGEELDSEVEFSEDEIDEDEDSVNDNVEDEESDATQEDDELSSEEELEDEEAMDESDEESEPEEENEAVYGNSWVEGDPCIVLSAEHISLWQHILEGPRPGPALKAVCVAISAVANFAHERPPTPSDKFKIEKANAATAMLKTARKFVGPALVKALKAGGLHNISLTRKYAQYQPVLEQYISSLFDIIDCLTTEGTTRKKVLKANSVELFSAAIAPLHGAFRKDAENNDKFVSKFVSLWSQAENTTVVEAVFTPIREIMTRDATIYQKFVQVLHDAYLTRSDNVTSAEDQAVLARMRHHLVHLYTLEHRVVLWTYGKCLQPVRDALAEADLNTVYSWRSVNTLLLWSQVVGAYYPLDTRNTKVASVLTLVSQLLQECLQLSQQLCHLPARVQYATAITALNASTQTFTPVLHSLVVMLAAVSAHKYKVKSENISILTHRQWNIRLSEADQWSLVVLRGCSEKLRVAVYGCLAGMAASPAFGDMAEPAMRELSSIKTGICVTFARRLEEDIRAHKIFLETKTADATFAIRETRKIRDFEIALRLEGGLPIVKAYNSMKNKEQKANPAKSEANPQQKIAKKLKRKQEKAGKKAKRLQRDATVCRCRYGDCKVPQCQLKTAVAA